MVCRICANSDLNTVYDFGQIPLSGYLVASLDDALDAKKYPNFLVHCSKCGLVQQGLEYRDIEIDRVYSNYQPTYSMSSSTREYMLRFIDEAILISDIQDGIVLEVGSNDGSMFDILRSKGVRPAGIDPSAEISADSDDTIVIRDYFSASVASDFVNKYGQVKLLFSRHTLEHAIDPVDFMNAVSMVLGNNGIAVIEVPYLPAQVSGNQYAGMCLQHISFFTLCCLEYLGKMHGLHIINAKTAGTDGGSIVVYFTKHNCPVESSSFHGLLDLERISRVQTLSWAQEKLKAVGTSMSLIKEHIQIYLPNKIVAYGAGSKGQAILNMLGLSYDIIPYVVDDTPGVNGMYIPGTGTNVVDSENKCLTDASVVLITAPTHIDEIVKKEHNRNPNLTFLRTSPDVSYVSNL